MLSRDLLRDDTGRVRRLLESRGVDGALLDRWQSLDSDRRAALVEVEEMKNQRNTASKEIGLIKRDGGNADVQIAKVAEIKTGIAEREEKISRVDEELAELEFAFPNVPLGDVPVGKDESANRVECRVGEPPVFDFEPKAHWDLGPELGLLDFEAGARVAGARFTVYRGLGARLERALINWMLDLHTGEHGYTEILPPFLVNRDALIGTGQLPKFSEDLFKIEGHEYFLAPTAEVPLTNLHRGEILNEADLPLRYTAWTPCFRSEAGSYGQDVRGLIRQHQFNKVELVQITTPEQGEAALEELVGQAEKVLQLLELPYQKVTLSTGDMGFSATKTYDLEVWLPGQGKYREISSCSLCSDFQARRAGIRYRPTDDKKVRYAYTLNGSGLAVGRTLIAVLENYQQADGSIRVPDVLRPYLRGLETITGA